MNNLQDFDIEIENFWKTLPNGRYTHGVGKKGRAYLIKRLKRADLSHNWHSVISRYQNKYLDEAAYNRLRTRIQNDPDNRQENLIRKHIKRIREDKLEHQQTRKEFMKATKQMKEKIYIVVVKVQVHNVVTGKTSWNTKSITLATNYPIVKGTFDERDMKKIDKNVRDLYDPYEIEVLQWIIQSFKEISSTKGFEKVLNRQKSIAYRFLEELNGNLPEQFYEDKLCAIRFIVNSLTDVRTFGMLTIPLVKSQFDALKVDYSNGLSVESMIYWIKTYYPNTLSLFAIDPCYNVFKTYVAERPEHTLMFVVNNGHIYPIYNDAIKKRVSQTKTLETGKVTWFVEGCGYRLIEKVNVSDSPLDDGIQQPDNQKYEDFLKGVNQDKNEVVLFESALEDVAKDLIKSVGYSVTAMKFRNSEIEAFQHPLTQQIIQFAPNYHQRQHVCQKLFELYPLYCFQFRNQSYNTLASSLFEVMFGKIPKSYHIKEDQQIIDEYHTSPLIETLVPEFPFDQYCKGFDIKKSYANAMINMNCDYPIFSICDSFEKYNGEAIQIGEYVLDECEIEPLGGLRIHKKVYGYNLVNYLLSNKYIDKSKILFFKKASYSFSAEVLSEFLKKIRSTFATEDDIFKALSVCFIGGLGKRFQTTDQCFITDDWETVCASFVDHKKENNLWSVQSLENLHFVKVSDKKRLYGEHSQLFRQVVSQGIIQLLELVKLVYVPNQSKLVGYNTDSVFIHKPAVIDFREHPQYKPEGWKPKKWKPHEPCTFKIEIPDMKWNELNEKEIDIKNLPMACIGGGGCGKTTTLVACNTPDTHVLSSTNKACDNIRQKGVQKVNTFDSYFYQSERISKNTKKVQIDEYSMMTHYWLKTIYKIWSDRPELIVQMFGDKNQCKAVCSYGRFFDYLQKRAFHAICGGNLLVKPYFKESARYDDELNEVVKYLLETGKMHPKLKNQAIQQSLKTNIVYLNDTRDKINAKFAQKFYVGQKVIAETNKKEKGLFNSKFYYIKEFVYKNANSSNRVLDKLKVSETPEGKPIHEKGFNVKYFRPAFAVTVFKYQGSTIEEPYNTPRILSYFLLFLLSTFYFFFLLSTFYFFYFLTFYFLLSRTLRFFGGVLLSCYFLTFYFLRHCDFFAWKWSFLKCEGFLHTKKP